MFKHLTFNNGVLIKLGLVLVCAFLLLFHFHTRFQLRAEAQKSEDFLHQRMEQVARSASFELDGVSTRALESPAYRAGLRDRLGAYQVILADLRDTPVTRDRSDRPVFSEVREDSAGRQLQSVWVPVRGVDMPEGRAVEIVLLLSGQSAGGPSALTGLLLGVFGSVGMLVLGSYGIRSMVQGRRRDVQQELGLKPDWKSMNLHPDTEDFVMDTFHAMIGRLKDKEQQLELFRQVAEERADHVEHYNRSILMSVSSGVMTFDQNALLTTCNLAAEKILELDSPEILGRHCRDVFESHSPIHSLVDDALHRGKVVSRSELELVVSPVEQDAVDGDSPVVRAIWVGVSTSLMKDHRDRVIGTILIFTDLTEIKRLQEQVELKKRLSLLGEVSAGIAHEFRNYMGTIMGYARLMEKRVGEKHPAAAMVQSILYELGMMDQLIGELLSFSRQPQIQREPVEINRMMELIVQQSLAVSRDTPPQLDLHLSPGLRPVLLDELLMRQALSNLVRNALEAMPEGGKLCVRTAWIKTPAWSGRPEKETDEGLEIEIQDTGMGIPPAIQPRIFLPLFTTKPEGTGMGLALAHKIILSHNGQIRVESQEGQGATFRVYLPVE